MRKASNKKVIVYFHHDRHCDDTIKIYEYSEENFEKVKQKCKDDWNMPRYGAKPSQYTDHDFEVSCGDDYISACSIREIEKI